jgi:hypothetical protein
VLDEWLQRLPQLNSRLALKGPKKKKQRTSRIEHDSAMAGNDNVNTFCSVFHSTLALYHLAYLAVYDRDAWVLAWWAMMSTRLIWPGPCLWRDVLRLSIGLVLARQHWGNYTVVVTVAHATLRAVYNLCWARPYAREVAKKNE